MTINLLIIVALATNGSLCQANLFKLHFWGINPILNNFIGIKLVAHPHYHVSWLISISVNFTFLICRHWTPAHVRTQNASSWMCMYGACVWHELQQQQMIWIKWNYDKFPSNFDHLNLSLHILLFSQCFDII